MLTRNKSMPQKSLVLSNSRTANNSNSNNSNNHNCQVHMNLRLMIYN